MNRFLSVLVLLFLYLASNGFAQDPLKVGSNIYKLVFENEQARLLEVTFKPGDSIGVHSHPDHFVYVTSAGKLNISVPGEKPQVFDLKKGEAVFIPAQSHTAVNVGNTEVKALVIELKKPKK